jgi:hypothetical protein
MKRGPMSDIAGPGLSDHALLRLGARLFDSSASLTWRGWTIPVWTILLWLFGIPLSTIGFFSMLFWAYGVGG